MIDSKEYVNPSFVRRCKAIMQNLKTAAQIDKTFFERALVELDRNDAHSALRIVRENAQCENLLHDHILQFNTWFQAFHKAARQLGKVNQVKNFNIEDKLISLQSKIKAKIPHSSYSLILMGVVKKQLKFDDDFMTKWRDQKKNLKQQRLRMYQQQKQQKKQKQLKQQENQKMRQKDDQIQKQAKNAQLQAKRRLKQLQQRQKQRIQKQKQKQKNRQIQKQKQQLKLKQKLQTMQAQVKKQTNQQKMAKQLKQKQQKAQKQVDLQKQQKLLQRYKEIQKMKSVNQVRFKKNKDYRFNCLLRYLESRKQFNFVSKQAVARELISNLEKFMKEKFDKVLKASKMRLPRYTRQEAGDQFKMYSNKSTHIQLKNAVLLPESDIKIFRLQYPSKAEQYLRLRVEEERQQQKFKNQFKQRLDTDKKTDKLLQSYILSEQKDIIHEFKRDEGPKKRDRLLINLQVVQYVIQSDPWFGDAFVMQKSFYRETL